MNEQSLILPRVVPEEIRYSICVSFSQILLVSNGKTFRLTPGRRNSARSTESVLETLSVGRADLLSMHRNDMHCTSALISPTAKSMNRTLNLPSDCLMIAPRLVCPMQCRSKLQEVACERRPAELNDLPNLKSSAPVLVKWLHCRRSRNTFSLLGRQGFFFANWVTGSIGSSAKHQTYMYMFTSK